MNKNWLLTLYFRKKKSKTKVSKGLQQYRIMDRTEHEAEKEAMSYIENVEPDCSDWTLVAKENIDMSLLAL